MGMSSEDVAAQLRCPHGELGHEFGQTMNLRNLSMIVGALAQLDVRDGDRVVEVGCGNGGLLGHVLSMAKGMHYTGVEISVEMVEEAKRFNAPASAAPNNTADNATSSKPLRKWRRAGPAAWYKPA